jgi:hypothetical protein
MSIILALVSQFWPYILIAGAALLGIGKAYFAGRTSAQNAQAASDLKAAQDARNIENDVSKLNPADLDKRLDRWVQPDK